MVKWVRSPMRKTRGNGPIFLEWIVIQTVVLCLFAFLAGFVDSIVGGGGLVQLPILLVFFSDVPIATVLGTNKLVAAIGTSAATLQYARKLEINWREVLPMAAVAFGFSLLGARVVSSIESEDLRPLIIVLLVVIALYIFFHKDFDSIHAPRSSSARLRWLGILAGAAAGFYDGFFGPGTGSFLIIIFIGLFGLSFLFASASAKVINLMTNLAGLLVFVLTGHVLYSVALPMIGFNVLGALTGTRLAILKGNRFVRVLFLVVVSVLILKLSYDTFLA